MSVMNGSLPHLTDSADSVMCDIDNEDIILDNNKSYSKALPNTLENNAPNVKKENVAEPSKNEKSNSCCSSEEFDENDSVLPEPDTEIVNSFDTMMTDDSPTIENNETSNEKESVSSKDLCKLADKLTSEIDAFHSGRIDEQDSNAVVYKVTLNELRKKQSLSSTVIQRENGKKSPDEPECCSEEKMQEYVEFPDEANLKNSCQEQTVDENGHIKNEDQNVMPSEDYTASSTVPTNMPSLADGLSDDETSDKIANTYISSHLPETSSCLQAPRRVNPFANDAVSYERTEPNELELYVSRSRLSECENVESAMRDIQDIIKGTNRMISQSHFSCRTDKASDDIFQSEVLTTSHKKQSSKVKPRFIGSDDESYNQENNCEPVWVMRDSYKDRIRAQEAYQQSRELDEKFREHQLHYQQQQFVMNLVKKAEAMKLAQQNSAAIRAKSAEAISSSSRAAYSSTSNQNFSHHQRSSFEYPNSPPTQFPVPPTLVSSDDSDNSDDSNSRKISGRKHRGNKYSRLPNDDPSSRLGNSSEDAIYRGSSLPPNLSQFSQHSSLERTRNSHAVASKNMSTSSKRLPPSDQDYDTDEETDRLLSQKGSHINNQSKCSGVTTPTPCHHREAHHILEERKKSRIKEVSIRNPDEPNTLIEGVLFRANYLGSTQLLSTGPPTKVLRMNQAKEAVGRIKAPEGEFQPTTAIDLFVSTEKIMILNKDLQEIMMDHALKTISYIADIDNLVVIMARRTCQVDNADDSSSAIATEQQRIDNNCDNTLEQNSSLDNHSTATTKTKIICHVLESEEAQIIAQTIGHAFQAAYIEFLRANGIEDAALISDMDYQDVLAQQEVFGEEIEKFSNKKLQKDIIVSKSKGESLGVVIVESGWGSMVPTVVLANMNPLGPAARCGRLNIGDQLISVNGISLVGLPLSTCQNYIKSTKPQTAVRVNVVPSAPVVEVLIRRPDIKYQLGFSVQNGVICSLLRGGIAERGGIRVGHRIIEIDGESVVAVPHERIVALLAHSIGEIHMKTMPTSIFRLLTGQEQPIYI